MRLRTDTKLKQNMGKPKKQGNYKKKANFEQTTWARRICLQPVRPHLAMLLEESGCKMLMLNVYSDPPGLHAPPCQPPTTNHHPPGILVLALPHCHVSNPILRCRWQICSSSISHENGTLGSPKRTLKKIIPHHASALKISIPRPNPNPSQLIF